MPKNSMHPSVLIISTNSGYNFTMINKNTFIEILPNVTPTGRSLIGNDSTKQIILNGMIPTAANSTHIAMQNTGIQCKPAKLNPKRCKYK